MSNDLIFLSNVRLSFPHLAEPQKKVNEQTGETRVSYNAAFLMPPDDPGFAAFMRRYGELALEKWKEHAQTVMQMIQNERKTRCYGYGQEIVSKTTLKPYDGYEGMVFINAGRDQAPQVIQADGRPVDPANTLACQQILRTLYAGCRVNAAVKPWLQENKFGRGVRCDLVAVQFARDDKPFGEGVTDASGMFGAVAQPQAAVAPAPAMPAPPFAAPGLPPFMMPQ
jgi:Protein of unknown function (DUF2815)